ncbi:hypothetical protein SAMN05444064_11245 [Pseudomonas syringae]|uniref:hypothetical protein n=1 Tax=Pseudomonas syringae TaxID=317 RepID=UPI000894B783|nr:hypothetical protein [Pseudomonas syringae]SDX08046.1 hypothetical protein SAMN05444514_11145 [Pseudomonas syringae]SFM25658.1 hypothetical protein SAMN05444064_11245 [Pseudomonas syringae]
MTQSSELTGGAGFTYEGSVAAYYLSALLTGDNLAPLNLPINFVGLQQATYGYPLDDIIVGFSSTPQIKLHLQVKRSLTISAAKTNTDFREIVKNSWLTYKSEHNSSVGDYYGAATGTTSPGALRTLRQVCQAARDSSDAQSFSSRVSIEGASSLEFKRVIDDIKTILTESLIVFDSVEFHIFLKRFVVLVFDDLTPESSIPASAVSGLQRVITNPNRAHELWERLKGVARTGAGTAGTYSIESLKETLYPLHTFRPQAALTLDGRSSELDNAEIINDTFDPIHTTILASTVELQSKSGRLTAIITTQQPNTLTNEVKSWRDVIKRSPFVSTDDKANSDTLTLTQLFKLSQFANILLPRLATTMFSAYIYYYLDIEAQPWTPAEQKRKMLEEPLLHRLSKKSEIIDTIFSSIPDIGISVSHATAAAQNKYRRTADPKISEKHSRNYKELVGFSDLIAEIALDAITKNSKFPPAASSYIATRVRYGENVVSREKHTRKINPLF